MHRENTSTPLEAFETTRTALEGAAPAPVTRRSPASLSRAGAFILPAVGCCPVSKLVSSFCWVWPALGLEPERLFGRKFHVWEGKDEALIKKSQLAKGEGGYRKRGEESISWVIEFCLVPPEGTSSQIIFHKATRLLQQAEVLGSTSTTRPHRRNLWKVQRTTQQCWNMLKLDISLFLLLYYFYFYFAVEKASLLQHLLSSRSRGETWEENQALPDGDKAPGPSAVATEGGWDPLLQKDRLQHWSLTEIWQVPQLPCLSFPIWGGPTQLCADPCKGLCHL